MNEHFVSRDVCPCCGSPACIELFRKAYNDEPLRSYLVSFYSRQGGVSFEYLRDKDYILVECAKCGLIYQREIPGESLMHKIYEEWIDPKKVYSLKVKSRSIDYYANLSREIVNVVRLLNRPPMELTFLDYSMGWGHWARIAKSFDITVHGTEFSSSRIEHARAHGVHVIEYGEIASKRYDFINTEQVFEHLPDPHGTLSYLKGSLKPGGIIKISVPNGWDIKAQISGLAGRADKGWHSDSLNAAAPLEHINCFTHRSLLQFAAELGLKPLASTSVKRSGNMPRVLYGGVRRALRMFQRLRNIRTPPVGQGTSMLFTAEPLPTRPAGSE